MTSVTMAPEGKGPSTAELLARRRAAAERPRFPLVLKLFFLTALVIVLVVGMAVGVTVQRANAIAHETVNSSISGAAKLFNELERQRLDRLKLAAQLVGSDANFAAYIQTNLVPEQGSASAPTATPAPDLVSILDQLTQRKESFGSDLVILLDDQGKVVARTDQPAVTSVKPEDLYEETPIVRKVVDDGAAEAASGVIVTGNRLFHGAVVPIGAGANRVRVGYLVNAYAIDDAFANRIAESTNAGVIFAAAHEPTLVRSSNAPSVGMQQMAGVESIFKTGRPVPPSNLTVDKSSYVMTGQPLTAGPTPVGAAVFVRSLDRELMPFRQIENALFAGGGAALLLAFAFSWLVAKRITRPIEELAGVAQAVAAGDYSVRPPMNQSDEVGILGRAFSKMITALHDKAALEELYEEMAARSQERESGGGAVIVKPASDEGTVLVTDLRGIVVGQDDAAAVIATVSRAMRIQSAEVARQDGTIREIEGQRLVSIFRGERSVIHAIRAARAINEELATRAETSAPLTIGVGMATGPFVTGSVSVGEGNSLAIVGGAPLLAHVLASHAPNGTAYISYESAQSAGGEVLASSTREEVSLKWLPQPLAVASVPLASMTTGMLRSIGASSLATMRIDSTVPGTTAPAGAHADLVTGQVFAGRYRIEQVLGRGGMGVVYRAMDAQLDEVVAIKTLPGDVLQRSTENLDRFKREIRLARKITHRNVLRTYDYGEAEGVYFISMEFVRGYTLSELLGEADDHRMPARVAIGIVRQISRGLHAAHEQGIIHRDIKPQNVLIDHKGEVKLMDFGIARMAESSEGMTQAGLIIGTPHYMSPEQVQGRQLDPRSDVYSMGVMFYEVLVGKRPFESGSLTGVLAAHITEKPKPPIDLRPDIGREVNAIVLRCLEKNPADRFSDAGDLLRDLDHVQIPETAVYKAS